MTDDETLDAVLVRYREVAQRTDSLIISHPSLDESHPLPEAPSFVTGARWSACRAPVRIVAETAQHAANADIIRETIDGAEWMG